MTTQKNINIDTKSQLAKLIATENLTVEHNKVKTASFDTVNRILTLPIFKVQSGDVYDMLIAHECSHALYTPTDGWKKIKDDDELRSYVNVLEDTRIDKLIQKKYPGVVRNYLNGFDVMQKQDFFGIKTKNIDSELMLIDKINLRSKSLNRLKFNFNLTERQWLKKVDALKTFNQVVKLAKEMLDWQKKQVNKLSSIPKMDDLLKAYDTSTQKDTKDGEDKSDFEKAIEESDKIKSEESSDDDADGDELTSVTKGGAGNEDSKKKFIAITDVNYENNKGDLYDKDKSYTYYNMPDMNVNKLLIKQKKFIKMFRSYIKDEMKKDHGSKEYYTWLKDDFKKFKNDNKKTVMYLVKEFEMKKSATAYRRANTDKTGIIDPLKLKNYKFSDDIFKRLTVLPDSKNHGMVMLLDWSGSMADVIKETVDQLCNLVWFCQKINIPYKVYFFVNDNHYDEKLEEAAYNKKVGDLSLSTFNLVEVANHTLNKRELDESMMYLYSMAKYYQNRYTRYGRDEYGTPAYNNFGMPREFNLGSTPLNEALVALHKIVPAFKNKYKVEKLSLITLTDGAANSSNGVYALNDEGKLYNRSARGMAMLRHGKKYFCQNKKHFSSYYFYGSDITANFLDMFRKVHKVTTIGFYIIKRLRGYDGERYFSRLDDTSETRKKQFSKDKCTTAKEAGYNEFYLINGKQMNVENTDLDTINTDMKVGKIKQIFGKSMKNRITSRVLLNKFISQVA